MNMNGKNRSPATTATQPVRPPAATPDPDSTSAFLNFGMFPSWST
jgi:hypothetical protein